jgi:Fe(3+) dicitrate transport protein
MKTRQSVRRNWFGTWNVFSLNFDTKITSRLSSNTKLFGWLVSEIVWFHRYSNIADAVNPATNSLANRRVDRDFYKTLVLKQKFLEYNLGKTKQHLAFGARLYKTTTRQQQGRGTTGNDFD